MPSERLDDKALPDEELTLTLELVADTGRAEDELTFAPELVVELETETEVPDEDTETTEDEESSVSFV